MKLVESILHKHQDEISLIQKEKLFSYTGGSAPRKMSVQLASECPMEFWLRALGYESTKVQNYFLEGSLTHGMVEQLHRAQIKGKFGVSEAKAYLVSNCSDKMLRRRIWSYFDAYLKIPTKFNHASLDNTVRYMVKNSEKKYVINAVNYFSGEVFSDDAMYQGRVDIIEDILAYPVSKTDGRILYICYQELVNAIKKIKTGDINLRREGFDFLIKKILMQKPVNKTQQATEIGIKKRKDQEIRSIEFAKRLLSKKPMLIKRSTSDLKTSSGLLDYEIHIGQLSYYSYLRGVTEGSLNQYASIINIEKKNNTKTVLPQRSRAIFSLKNEDFIEVVNKLERANYVVDKKITTQNFNRCTNCYYRGQRCDFYNLCHAEKIHDQGINHINEIKKTIKRRKFNEL